MAKPSGPSCNLNCEYCFYLEKHSILKNKKQYRMSDEVLEAYIRKIAEYNRIPELTYAWQGGEPALSGLDFYKKAIKLQEKYSEGRRILNSFQTNGTLLNKDWCDFFHQYGFLVGLSLDGPENINDYYRKDIKGLGTYNKILSSLKLMQQSKVEFNVLSCVNNVSSKHPLEVYRFLKNNGVRFIQFIPIVERQPDEQDKKLGLSLSAPPKLKRTSNQNLTSWSVKPTEYGNFLSVIFDEWIRNDVGSVFIMNFEWALCGFMGMEPTACQHRKVCGDALILEHNGDIYSCDHFMYPEYRLGNILNDSLDKIVLSKKQIEFGCSKNINLPVKCKKCEFLSLCNGGCIKHRFIDTSSTSYPHNYLCDGYKDFYRHSKPYFTLLGQIIRKGYPPQRVMEFAKRNFIPKLY